MFAEDFSKEFEEFALTVMNSWSLGLFPLHDVKEGLELYMTLIKEVEKLTFDSLFGYHVIARK